MFVFTSRIEEKEKEMENYEKKAKEVSTDVCKIEDNRNIFIILMENTSQILDYYKVLAIPNS